jgi:hypothetical protein
MESNQKTKPPILTGSSGPAVLNLQLRAAKSDDAMSE